MQKQPNKLLIIKYTHEISWKKTLENRNPKANYIKTVILTLSIYCIINKNNGSIYQLVYKS